MPVEPPLLADDPPAASGDRAPGSGEVAQSALRVGPGVLAAGAADGPLAGLRTVVKDVFDVAGERTGAGNPDFLADAPAAAEHAWAVRVLVEAGATVIGKAHTDELAFSLSGTNVHYGTPRNPRVPGRIPGGSSSGSASAVAGGIVPFALATDTGGSTRIPASYCGIFGMRPTHGRLPMAGAVALAPSFDTVGVLAESGTLLGRAMGALLTAASPGSRDAGCANPTGVVLADDVFALASPEVAAATAAAAGELAGLLGVESRHGTLADGRLERWREFFMARQLPDVWATHGEWVTRRRPALGPGVASRLRDAAAADPARAGLADRGRAELDAALDALLPPGAVLAIPTSSSPAPPADLDTSAKVTLRGRTLLMTCLAGLGGLPAVSLPLALADGLPVGLCLLARRGEDERLLAVAARADALLPARETASPRGASGSD